ncbi:MAG: hypothetical protein QF515_07630 [Pseudomonadales bacterium]|nr:hypothetical protein [Pseudomonadales bacterium]|tara:strand:+ start:99 stop:473 length:375 start_codon:yes stop_codon:yes gene_type:complete
MYGILPVTFRFRGKVRRLFNMYTCFLKHPGIGLHPTQVSRYTGIAFAEVVVRLDATPELFVRLPKRKDGITRYRLTSATAAREPEDVQKMLNTAARRESMMLWAISAMIVCVLVIVMILIGPTL